MCAVYVDYFNCLILGLELISTMLDRCSAQLFCFQCIVTNVGNKLGLNQLDLSEQMSELKPVSVITWTLRSTNCKYWFTTSFLQHRVQELCESRGGRPGLSVLTSLTVSVDVKQHWTMHTHWSQFVPNMSTDIRGHQAPHHHHHPSSNQCVCLHHKSRKTVS